METFNNIAEAEKKIETYNKEIDILERDKSFFLKKIQDAEDYINKNNILLKDIYHGAIFYKEYDYIINYIVIVETGYDTNMFYFCGHGGKDNPMLPYSDSPMTAQQVLKKLKNLKHIKFNGELVIKEK